MSLLRPTHGAPPEPIGGARTWETKGSKHVLIHGVDDKRQFTVAASSAASGEVLPFQVIFQGLTSCSLPPLNDGRHDCNNVGWHLTQSSNHWSTLDTCKEFVQTILVTYRALQIDLFNLPNDLTMIWLIDCWSVHISKDF
jgi:hypothetical protein